VSDLNPDPATLTPISASLVAPKGNDPENPLRPRGSNHGGMRQFNERIILQTIRLHGPQPKADVARMTHLSSQTASVIINKLLDEGLLMRQDRLRGRIGQPSIPIALNPDGAFSIGIQIGRRTLTVLALDFTGQVRHRENLAYDFPDPGQVFPAISRFLTSTQWALGESSWQKVVGIGVAAPLHLSGWQELLSGTLPVNLGPWDAVDIPARVASASHLPVEFAKDTSAACVAELVAGRGRSLPTFIYFYIGTFIGGGLVIDSHLYPGQSGNAGAMGSFPTGVATKGNLPSQLLAQASGLTLENALRDAGLPPEYAHDHRALEGPALALTNAWLARACPAIAMAIVSSTALLELDGAIIDGTLDRGLLAMVIQGVKSALLDYNQEGLHMPLIQEGGIGPDAKAMGGALLPLYAHFAPDRAIFLK
jgi:predicted NBD/HSP70 family sugar kinase